MKRLALLLICLSPAFGAATHAVAAPRKPAVSKSPATLLPPPGRAKTPKEDKTAFQEYYAELWNNGPRGKLCQCTHEGSGGYKLAGKVAIYYSGAQTKAGFVCMAPEFYTSGNKKKDHRCYDFVLLNP